MGRLVSRREFLKTAAAACGAAMTIATEPQAAGEKRRPNIVILLADDLGYKDLSCYGCADIQTPHLDRLAAEGVRFTHFYSNGAECTPTRAALLTGRYQHRVGGLECAIGTGNVGRYDDAERLAKQDELGLPVDHTSIARMLKGAGYATGICGKWHLGYNEKFSPNRHGFDYAFYALGGGMDYFHHTEEPPVNMPVLRLNEKPVKREGYFTDLVAEEAERFIAKRAGAEPFFLYVPFTAPHAPYQGPADKAPEPLPEGSPRWSQGKAQPEVYAAMVERMDAACGRILAALEKAGAAGETMVIFMSDNGGTGSARPYGLRGQKGTPFEGGIRVPCIVRWPGRLKAGQTSKAVGIGMDLTASIAAAAGVEAAKERPFDGIDILNAVAQGKEPERRLFWRQRRAKRTTRAARDGSLKLVIIQDGGKLKEEYLFDLAQDPMEETNLLERRPADAARLRRALAAWEVEVKHSR